jgi:hypothetical protein
VAVPSKCEQSPRIRLYELPPRRRRSFLLRKRLSIARRGRIGLAFRRRLRRFVYLSEMVKNNRQKSPIFIWTGLIFVDVAKTEGRT